MTFETDSKAKTRPFQDQLSLLAPSLRIRILADCTTNTSESGK